MPSVRSFRARLAAACLLFPLLALASCGKTEAEIPTSNPPLAKHALIVSIDGCRPDMLLRAQLDLASRGERSATSELMKQGSYTLWARTTAMSVTLPSHTSMLTGVTPEVHGVTWNDGSQDNPVIYPAVPTIFEIARAKGLTNAVFAGKVKFILFTRPISPHPADLNAAEDRGDTHNVANWNYIVPKRQKADGTWTEQFIDDHWIAEKAADAIRKHKPNLTFVHLSATDLVGHKKYPWVGEEKQGWGTNEQMWCIERADACIAMLADALKEAGIYQDTLIIISADHGGAGGWHGPDDPRSRHIPWICVGPGVRKDYDLTRNRDLIVRTEDTFATASYFLGLPINPQIQGRPVLKVLQQKKELLK